MTTRSAKSRQLERQLQLALQELKKYKEQCEQLIVERNDNEIETLNVINRNTFLKAEMTQLHSLCLEAQEERDRLKRQTGNFDRCAIEYEENLRTMSELQSQLSCAYKTIEQLELKINKLESSHTQSLYEELVMLNKGKDCIGSTATIDLTGDDSVSHTPTQFNCNSKNKLKKYIKLQKFIKKTKRLIKGDNIYRNHINLSKKYRNVINQCKIFSCEVDSVKNKYEADILTLNSRITSLHNSLEDMTDKYSCAQQQIGEHISAMDEILLLSQYNEQRLLSLTNNCQCHFNETNVEPPLLSCEPRVQSDSFIEKVNYINKSEILLFSDDIGKNIGTKLYQSSGKIVPNHCMPGAAPVNILDKVLCGNYTSNTTII